MESKAPRYLALVLEHARACELGPGVHQVEVRHEDGCALITGKGPCDCTPVIVSGPAIDAKLLNRRERRRRQRGHG